MEKRKVTESMVRKKAVPALAVLFIVLFPCAVCVTSLDAGTSVEDATIGGLLLVCIKKTTGSAGGSKKL